MLRRHFREVVRSGHAVHACKEACKLYRASVRRSKRAHSKHLKAAFLDKLHSKMADLHSLLRSPQRAHQSPLSEQAWQTYLDDHFGPPWEVQDSRPSPSDMAVPLGRGHPPPAQLLANGAATAWFPLPDSMPAPALGSMCSLLAERLKRLKGSSSSGLDMVATLFLKYAVCNVPRAEGRGFDAVHALLPLLAQLFLLSFESARVPADWIVAKTTPLYKTGPMLDPNSYRMLAVSGTMYSTVRECHLLPADNLVHIKKQIPDTQFGFNPGWSTLQPMFIRRHLQHAARTIKPSISSRLHTAFIDFKQAYDNLIPGRLFDHISLAYACLQFSFLIFKACMLVTSTSFKTGIKLHGLSLLWV